MPELRLPKRDTEGLPSATIDNNPDTNYYLHPYNTLTISYATTKYVYGILLVCPPEPGTIELRVEISPNGTSFAGARSHINLSSLDKENLYVEVNGYIKAWRIVAGSHPAVLREIIVLTPDDTKPTLPIYYPDTLEIINSGTTNLDSFANLANISDGNDDTYASFVFRPGYDTYTLQLRGYFSLPLISLISPFILAEITPDGSNLPTVMNPTYESHMYFYWGAVSSVSGATADTNTIRRIANSPRLLWSQKAYEIGSGGIARGILDESFLTPTSYSTTYTRFVEALRAFLLIGSKTLYIPYFLTYYWRPIFIGGLPYHIYYATCDPREPFIYVAAHGSTNKIQLTFGLRIKCNNPVNQSFTLRIYGMGFICFPQIDVELPLTLPSGYAWYEHTPLNSATRDGNESTESPDITTDEYFVSFYPVAVNVASPATIRYRVRSTSGGSSTIRVRRYNGFHQPSDNTIQWYHDYSDYTIGESLQSVDITGADSQGKTNIIKVEIVPQ